MAIVERLGGVPLAIELVAARAHAYALSELRLALEADFSAVGGGGLDRAERHRSLEASFAWSRLLLTPNEQIVLRRTVLFAAPFDKAALAAVCADVEQSMTNVMQSLIELGFLTPAPAPVGNAASELAARWQVPAGAREFIAGADATETSDPMAFDRMARWFLSVAQQHDRTLASAGGGVPAGQALAALAADHDHCFAALAQAHERQDAVMVGSLVQALGRYWAQSGAWARADPWMHRATALAASLEPEPQATLLLAIAAYWLACQRYALAQIAARRASEVAQAAGLVALQARASNAFCTSSYHLGETDQALDTLLQTRDAAQAAGLSDVIAACQNNIANCQLTMGHLSQARATWLACDRLYAVEPNQARVAPVFNLALVAHYQGDDANAERGLLQALAFEQVGLPRPARVVMMLMRSAWMACCRGDAPQAEHHLQRAQDAAEAAGQNVWQRIGEAHHGKVAFVRGQTKRAIDVLARGIAACQGTADPWDVLDLRLWLFWAQSSVRGGHHEARETLDTLLWSYHRSWRHEHPRMLEAAASWLAQAKQFERALPAWQQAQALRAQEGIKRFAFEQTKARQTRMLMRDMLAAVPSKPAVIDSRADLLAVLTAMRALP
jgi:tetratricopeptide (TPR) repeat protein